jgi:hypothetical protein
MGRGYTPDVSSQEKSGGEPQRRFMRRIDPRDQRHFERVVQGYVRALRAPAGAAGTAMDAASRIGRFTRRSDAA